MVGTKPQPQVKKREDKQKRKEEVKSESSKGSKKVGRHIVREVKEEDWEHDGYEGEGKNKRKTFKCKICGADEIRRDNRRVHACAG